MIEDMLSYSHDKALSEVGRIDKRYDKARLFSPINLADYGGDIERAMEHIVNSEKSTIAKRLNEELSGYEGQTITEMGFGLWNRILDSGYLADSLIKLDGLHTVTPEDAAEFEDYSRILNFKVLSKLLMEQGGEEYYGLLEDFVLNGHFSNPYFRADSVSTLNRKLYPEMEDLFSRSQVDPEVLYALSKKIVDINSSYPCHVEDPYVCPKVVRNIVDSNHVKAHVSISFAALNSDSDRQREAEYYAINFLTKFYPGVDFVNGDLAALQNASNSITNNYVPFIMVNAGTTSYGYDDCLAEKFLNAALIAECTHSAEMPYFGLCKEEQDYASEYLDFIRYNGNCE